MSRNGGHQRGATLVEYVLGVGLIVLASIGALDRLDANTEGRYEEASAGAENLPGSGGFGGGGEPIATTTTTSVTTTTVDSSPTTTSTTTTIPSSTTTTTTTIAPRSTVHSMTDRSTSQNGQKWRAIVRVSVRDSVTGAAVSGATVSVRMTAANGSRADISCTTNGAGECDAEWGNRTSAHDPVLATITNMTANPTWDGIPSSIHLPRP